MRKIQNRPRPMPSARVTGAMLAPDPDNRSGRVGGAQVAFGAPGPRIDLDRVLGSWRDGTTVGGAAQPAPVATAPPERPARPRTVALSDGTMISFTVAGSSFAVEEP